MVGFLSNQPDEVKQKLGVTPQAEAPQPAESEMAPEADEGMEDGEPATAEEQAEYDLLMNNAFALIYSGKGEGGKAAPNEAIVESLKGNGNTVDGLANTAFIVVKRLEDSAAQAGKTFEPYILLHAGSDILAELAELQEALGIDEAVTEDEMNQALTRAVNLYRTSQQNDPNVKTRAGEDLKMMAEATARGELGRLLPGGDKALADAQKVKPKAAPAEPEMEEV